jgi:hypothetical protein
MIDIVPSIKKRQGPPLPLSDIAVTDSEDKLLRQSQREDNQEAALRAAMLAVPPQRAAATASPLQYAIPHCGSDAEAHAGGGAEDGDPKLPLPPALRPGSMPIMIPSNMHSREAQTSLRGSMAGADPHAVDSVKAAAAVGGAVLNLLKDQRDSKAGPTQGRRDVTRQGEQPRPSPHPGPVGSVGAALLDMLYEQKQQGLPGDSRQNPPLRERSPEGVEEAVGTAVLDSLQRQATLLQQRQAQKADIPTAVGAAVLDMMALPPGASGRDQGQGLPRQAPSSVETQGAVGVAVLDDLQQQLNERRQREAVAAGSERRAETARQQLVLPGEARAPPRVEMAVGAAYLDSLDQPQQSPLVAMDIGAAVLSTLKDQKGSRR